MFYPFTLLTVTVKFQPQCWLVVGLLDNGFVFGAFGLLVKVGRK